MSIRYFSRLVSLFLITIIIVACGSAPTANQVSDAPAADSSDQASSEPAAQDVGVDGDVVRIGLVSPLSGPLGILGEWMSASAQAEVDRINAEGGLLGKQVELIVRDDELNPQKTVEIVREFIDRERVQMIIGPSLTAFALATKDLVTQAQVIQFLPTVSGEAALENAPYTFRTLEPIGLQMNEIAEWLAEHGHQRIGMVVADDATGEEYMALLPPAVEAAGMEYVGHEIFRADDQDLTTQVLKVQELGADALMIGTGNSALAAKIIVAARNLDYDARLIGVSGLEGGNIAQLVGDGIAGVVFTNTYRGYQAGIPMDEMPAGYVSHVKAVLNLTDIPSGEERDYGNTGMSTSTGDAVFIWADAVRRAGTFNGDAVRAALQETNIPAAQSPSGGNLVITPDNHNVYREGSLFFYEWQKLDNGALQYRPIE